MRIRVLSDLHLEFQSWNPPEIAADVVVLAGDIHVGDEGILWGRSHFPGAEIIYVPGNHEFYGGEMEDVRARMRHAARKVGVHLLDAESVVIRGVRFLGATLWTDFALDGQQQNTVARAMAIAQSVMVDYRAIRYKGEEYLSPVDTQQFHRLHAGWLRNELNKPYAGQTVVVTHHLPHAISIHGKYARSPLNPAFASDLSELVREPVALWIHGHTHESMDYMLGGTRVVCNPRGYLPAEPNPLFEPALVVEVPGRD
jgi:predicted phosphodiesterase